MPKFIVVDISQMGSFSRVLLRPLPVAAATAVALSLEFPERLPQTILSNSSSKPSVSDLPTTSSLFQSWVQAHSAIPTTTFSSFSPNAALPVKFSSRTRSSPDRESSWRWHFPNPQGCSEMTGKSTVVVLLGWLGAEQKHLKKYAEWYTARGFHVVTFTFSMSDIVNYKVGGIAERNVESLVDDLVGWVGEELGKNMVFHSFSNTGWLTYGVILENFNKHDPSLMERIKGCVVDSAPVAAADPQVWASGFSAAILKKQSVATKGLIDTTTVEPKPATGEVALLALLDKFFQVVLNLPSINRRLSDVMELLSTKQPNCPQLYMYSSADKVIPAKSVELFVERQRQAGHEVRACNFVSSPHVDHFRNNPNLYTSQLTTFLQDHGLTN